MDGRSDLEQHERALEELMIEIIGSFVNPRLSEVDELIVDAQRRIVSHLGLERSFLACSDGEAGPLVVTHSWAVPGIKPTPKQLAEKKFPHCVASIRGRKPVVLGHLADLPLEAEADRASLRALGVKSVAMFPVVAARQEIGVLVLGAKSREFDWQPDLVRHLRFVAEALASVLLQRQQSRRLNEALALTEDLKERLDSENVILREEIRSGHDFCEIVRESPAIKKVLREVDEIAPTESSVLLLGEAGTGKELIARALHARSRRAERALVKVDCASLPGQLVESELFGHEKGTLASAVESRTGRFEMADGATLLLDEIGELSLECQSKLLRVLQSGEFERLGSSVTRHSDVRIIAATNRNLRQAVTDERFRPDLFSRFVVIDVPPLRERPEDIPALTALFIERCRGKLGKRIDPIPTDAMDRLIRYAWPGNIRELAHVVERAMIRSKGSTLTFRDELGDDEPPKVEPPAAEDLTARPRPLVEVEREHIRSVCEGCGWRIRGAGGAAEILGLNPSTLHSRMKKLEIGRPSFARSASHGGRRPARGHEAPGRES